MAAPIAPQTIPYRAWLRQAAAAPLQPGLSVAADEFVVRQQRPNAGWATVPPADPPLVHVGLDPDASHEA